METPPTVEALLASFPCKDHDIAKISGEPDRITLNALFKAIRRNAASVYSDKGGGRYGHLALTMEPIEYIALQHGTAFVLEAHPGVLTFTAEDKTVVQREDARDIYNRAKFAYLVEQNVTLALKNTMMSKLPEATYITLCNEHVHYEDVTVWELIDHLETNYGEKTTIMLTENVTAMQADFDISQPSIEGLFVRQNELQRFAADTAQAISDGFWVLYTINVIDHSGLLHKGVQKWEAQAAAYKTPANLKTDFTKYHKSYLKKRDNDNDGRSAYSIQELTSKMELMFAQANAQTDRINDLTALATTASDTSIPGTIVTQSDRDRDEILSLRSANAALQCRLCDDTKSDTKKGRDKSRTDDRHTDDRHKSTTDRIIGIRGNNDRRKSRRDDGRTKKRFNNCQYCHTHGYDVAENHGSKDCNYPDKNHDFTATLSDTKDGCQLYKRLVA